MPFLKQKDNQQQNNFQKKETDNIIYKGKIQGILDDDLKPFNNKNFCAIKTKIDNFINTKISKKKFITFCVDTFGIDKDYAELLMQEYFGIHNEICSRKIERMKDQFFKNNIVSSGGSYKKKTKSMKKTNKKKSLKKRKGKTMKRTKKH